MATVTVTHQIDNQFQIDVRGHQLRVDQPRKGGAGEAGPTPTELFVASLAACVGHYATSFLRRHEQPYQGLQVECDWAMRAAQPARVGRIDLRVIPPSELPERLQAGLAAAIEQCTVHNSLRRPPPVTIRLAGVPAAVAVAAEG